MAGLIATIHSIADRFGTDYLGIADMTPIMEAAVAQGGEMLRPYPRCVVAGVAMFDSIVDMLPRAREDCAVSMSYLHHSYEVLNRRLDLIASTIAGEIQAWGYSAFPMAASKRVDDERICAIFSHKMGARQAGLGWIGKSCMLITPDRGPRVRWVTVLTDAPLMPTGKPMEQQCGDCTECVKACPVQAYTGRNYAAGEPREMRFDARKCQEFLAIKGAGMPEKACGMCVYACPYGKK
jgi:epoxyqueuosine reductase